MEKIEIDFELISKMEFFCKNIEKFKKEADLILDQVENKQKFQLRRMLIDLQYDSLVMESSVKLQKNIHEIRKKYQSEEIKN